MSDKVRFFDLIVDALAKNKDVETLEAIMNDDVLIIDVKDFIDSMVGCKAWEAEDGLTEEEFLELGKKFFDRFYENVLKPKIKYQYKKRWCVWVNGWMGLFLK